jgi:hypothetical protein
MKGLLIIITVTVASLIIMVSCRKDDLISDHDAKLYFSTDTVYFDTVLSTLGSITRQFKIYNRHNQPIEISELFLGRRENSYYRLNVDGTQGKEFRDIRIEPGDSIYVFVAVTIDPQDEVIGDH